MTSSNLTRQFSKAHDLSGGDRLKAALPLPNINSRKFCVPTVEEVDEMKELGAEGLPMHRRFLMKESAL